MIPHSGKQTIYERPYWWYLWWLFLLYIIWKAGLCVSLKVCTYIFSTDKLHIYHIWYAIKSGKMNTIYSCKNWFSFLQQQILIKSSWYLLEFPSLVPTFATKCGTCWRKLTNSPSISGFTKRLGGIQHDDLEGSEKTVDVTLSQNCF